MSKDTSRQFSSLYDTSAQFRRHVGRKVEAALPEDFEDSVGFESRFGVSTKTVSRVMKGEDRKPRADTWDRIAKACGARSSEEFKLACLDSRSDEPEDDLTAEPMAPSVGRPSREITPLPGAAISYSYILRVIKHVEATQKGEKRLYLGALHGLESEKAMEADTSEAKKAFDDAVHECIRSHGDDGWHVKILYHIGTEARFRIVEERLQQTARALRFEARAYCCVKGLPVLSPLIIGREDIFLGIQDKFAYRVDKALHIRGVDSVTLLETYWRRLWYGRGTFKIRTEHGVQHGEMSSLLAAINRRPALLEMANRHDTDGKPPVVA